MDRPMRLACDWREWEPPALKPIAAETDDLFLAINQRTKSQRDYTIHTKATGRRLPGYANTIKEGRRRMEAIQALGQWGGEPPLNAPLPDVKAWWQSNPKWRDIVPLLRDPL